MATISGVLLYTCIQRPTKKYKDEVNKEYKVTVVVDEDTADAWDEQFAKQPAKTVKTADFEKEYRVAPPFPDAKKQYLITLKKDAQYADGNPLDDKYKPKVFIKNDAGKLVDITQTKLVGNGSFGVVSYEVRENDYGTFAKLKNIRVDDLVEYADAGGPGDDELGELDDSTGDDDFDADQGSDPKDSEPAKKTTGKPTSRPAGKPTGKPAAKTGNAVADMDDSDAPF